MPDKKHDVFLSYNSDDLEEVETLVNYLEDKAGLKPWFDKWKLIGGESVIKNLSRGLKASTTCAVFVGKSGEGPWQNREVESALRQQTKNPKYRVIPVLLPDAPKEPELPLFLAGNMWVDFRGKKLDDDRTLWELECGILGKEPGKGRPKSITYKGSNTPAVEKIARPLKKEGIKKIFTPAVEEIARRFKEERIEKTLEFDVFLSYNSSDLPAVKEIAFWLEEMGIKPWFDKWELISASPNMPSSSDLVKEALQQSACCTVFVGPSGIWPWDREIQAAITTRANTRRAGQPIFRVIPVLLPFAVERMDLSLLPDFLLSAPWVEFRQTLDDAEAFLHLVCEITGITPGQ